MRHTITITPDPRHPAYEAALRLWWMGRIPTETFIIFWLEYGPQP